MKSCHWVVYITIAELSDIMRLHDRCSRDIAVFHDSQWVEGLTRMGLEPPEGVTLADARVVEVPPARRYVEKSELMPGTRNGKLTLEL